MAFSEAGEQSMEMDLDDQTTTWVPSPLKEPLDAEEDSVTDTDDNDEDMEITETMDMHIDDNASPSQGRGSLSKMFASRRSSVVKPLGASRSAEDKAASEFTIELSKPLKVRPPSEEWLALQAMTNGTTNENENDDQGEEDMDLTNALSRLQSARQSFSIPASGDSADQSDTTFSSSDSSIHQDFASGDRTINFTSLLGGMRDMDITAEQSINVQLPPGDSDAAHQPELLEEEPLFIPQESSSALRQTPAPGNNKVAALLSQPVFTLERPVSSGGPRSTLENGGSATPSLANSSPKRPPLASRKSLSPSKLPSPKKRPLPPSAKSSPSKKQLLNSRSYLPVFTKTPVKKGLEAKSPAVSRSPAKPPSTGSLKSPAKPDERSTGLGKSRRESSANDTSHQQKATKSPARPPSPRKQITAEIPENHENTSDVDSIHPLEAQNLSEEPETGSSFPPEDSAPADIQEDFEDPENWENRDVPDEDMVIFIFWLWYDTSDCYNTSHQYPSKSFSI